MERYFPPGRSPKCVPCGIKASAAQQLEFAGKKGPGFAKSAAQGARFAHEFHRQEGEWFEKWQKGMRKAAERRSALTRHPSATMPGNVDRKD